MANNPLRTKERFKYRNAAIRQGDILGIPKLLLITCCEFAHDDGTFYHGYRALAKACGISKSAAERAMETLLAGGVIQLVRRGNRRVTNKYRIVLEMMPKVTVYDLVARLDSPTEGHSVPYGTSVSHRDDRVAANGTQRPPVGQKMLTLDVDLGNVPERKTEEVDLSFRPSKPVLRNEVPRQGPVEGIWDDRISEPGADELSSELLAPAPISLTTISGRYSPQDRIPFNGEESGRVKQMRAQEARTRRMMKRFDIKDE